MIIPDYRIYGVNNDEENIKLTTILKVGGVSFEFFDLRDTPPSDAQLDKWGEFDNEELPINTKSTSYKKNRRNYDHLELPKKRDWLRKNFHLINRPIIEDSNGVVLSIGGRPERLAKVIFNLP